MIDTYVDAVELVREMCFIIMYLLPCLNSGY